MTASVEAANPEFDEALASLAHLGRKIDQAVRSTTLASLNSLGFRGTPPFPAGSGLIETSVPADVGNPEESNSTASTPRTVGSEATPGNPAYSSQTLAQAIADSLKLVLWPKLDEVVQKIQECCNSIAEAVTQITTAVSSIEAIAKAIEACKCAALPSDLMSSLTRIEKALAEAAKTDLGEALGIAASIMAVVGAIATVVAVIADAPAIAAIAALASALAGLVYLGQWAISKFKDDHDVLNKAEPRTDTILDEMRMRTTEPLEHLPELRRRDREEMLLGALRYFENLIGQLQQIINDPAAEHDVEASARRARAQELLPSILRKYQELRELFIEKTLRYPPTPENLRDDLQDPEERNVPGDDDVPSPVNPGISSYSPDRVSYNSMQLFEGLEQMLRPLIDRLKEPVRLEVRLLDDRVIARRLDGNRAVSVDLSRGYRLVGYIPV
jgi:hypothetical protein